MNLAENDRQFISAIIPAAGQGSRMKAAVNKQYLMLRGKPILSYTLDVFEKSPLIDEIILVINPNEFALCQKEVLKPYRYQKVKLTAGGATRQASVFEGLKAVNPACRMAVIHDGARPLLSDNVLGRCIAKARESRAAITAVPAKNTIKVINEDGTVDHTPDRNTLYEVNTPQCFDYQLILEAHQRAAAENVIGTDDASLVEYIGEKVYIVRDQYHNIKITTPEDLIFAESILSFSH